MKDARPAQDRYEKMLASSSTAAVCAGANNLILAWNSAAELLFGYSSDQAIGQPLSIIIPARLRAAHDAGLARASKAGRARLAGQSVEILALHADGSELPVDLSLSLWFEDGIPIFGALLRDVTDRSRAQRRLEHLAHCDTLTSLPNRNALQARLTAAIESEPCTLLILDLDGFKHVNDNLGHSCGDELLTQVASRISAAVGDAGLVARLGGDEFAVLLVDNVDPLLVDQLTTMILKTLRVQFVIAGQSVFISASIGIAMSPRDASTSEELLSRADLALYVAKSSGGSNRVLFNRAMQDRSEQQHRLGIDLHFALESAQFELCYQPQIDLRSGRLTGAETLLRWRHPVYGFLQPNVFIDVLERSAVSEAVGDWIIDQACATAVSWHRAGLGNIRLGVNLFHSQLRSGRLFDVVVAALHHHGLAADQLELEITETTVHQDSKQSTAALTKLNAIGVKIAFDDFGTGYASLSLLQKLPITRLKIDRSFISQICERASDAAIVGAVIAMARSLNLEVIAEGVETADQETTLLDLNCEEAQGFRYGRPMPANEVLERYLGTNQLKFGMLECRYSDHKRMEIGRAMNSILRL